MSNDKNRFPSSTDDLPGDTGLGAAADGPSAQNLGALHAALTTFHAQVARVQAGQASAHESVLILESWVQLGQRLLDLAEPWLKQTISSSLPGTAAAGPAMLENRVANFRLLLQRLGPLAADVSGLMQTLGGSK